MTWWLNHLRLSKKLFSIKRALNKHLELHMGTSQCVQLPISMNEHRLCVYLLKIYILYYIDIVPVIYWRNIVIYCHNEVMN